MKVRKLWLKISTILSISSDGNYLGGDGSNARTMAMRSQNSHFTIEAWFYKIATLLTGQK